MIRSYWRVITTTGTQGRGVLLCLCIFPGRGLVVNFRKKCGEMR